jgi:hypothetical protein
MGKSVRIIGRDDRVLVVVASGYAGMGRRTCSVKADALKALLDHFAASRKGEQHDVQEES